MSADTIPGAAQFARTQMGLLSAIPAAGTLGARYIATDAAVEFYDTGAAWVPISGVSAMSTTTRDTLSGAGLFDGRTIYNTTTAQLETYSLGTTSWVGAGGSGFYRTFLPMGA